MPFTLSHPAAVLLLGRPPLVASALVAGTVAPDLPYVLPQATSAGWGPYSAYNLTFTHEPGTGLIAGTAGALVLLVLYHQLLKRPLLALLPEVVAGRVLDAAERFRWAGAARPAWIVVSAVIGVLTHLLWDALVHENRPDSPTTEALWWASTLAGLLAVVAWLVSWLRRAPGRPLPPRTVLGPAGRLAAAATLVAAGLAGVIVSLLGREDGAFDLAALRQAVAGGMSGVAVGLLLYAALWHLRPGRAGN
ncbi:DUF4184 family protein [Actinoplanes sp. RD1]|uniref:DUF4184 family protein n=1 Tax=Actinoplanes sp. RD1 TaxID=3064538 RepID=UPI002741ABBC|nr:DUF4184 family protein [Actinoplanes sp. RD1]